MCKEIILIGSNDFVIEHFFANLGKKNLLLLDSNIIELEKIKNKFNITVFPLNNDDSSFYVLFNLLKNKFKSINEIIFSVNYTFSSIPFNLISLKQLRFFFDINFNSLFLLLKHLSILIVANFNKFSVTFIINKGSADKNNFLFLHECINNLLITYMKCLSKEYNFFKKVNFNCISLENVDFFYKKNVYPFRYHKFNVNHLYLVYYEMINKCIKNKIFVV